MISSTDLDIGERLYARNTAASIRKRCNTKNTQVLEAAWSNYSEQGVDVKAEVDRMFGSIMESIESDPKFAEPLEELPTRRFGMVLDATTNSRIAATQALMRKHPTKAVYHNTFGSGRAKMSAPVSKTDEPGPGQYYPDEDVYASLVGGGGRCASASGRSSASSRIGGGGSSEVSSSAQAQRPKRGFSFGTGKRSTFEGLIPGDNRAKQLSVPGPGEYKVPGAFEAGGPRSTKGSFSTAGRPSAGPREVTPGPGSYALDDVRAKVDQLLHDARASPAFNSTSPRMPSPRSQAPGPGTYHNVERGQSPPPLRDTPMYSFPKASPKPAGSDAPGPGTYDLTKESTVGQYRGGIPSAARDEGVWGGKKKFTEPAPGPGTYNPPTESSTGLPITLKFRYDDKVNSNPGPGQYDVLAHEKPSGPLWSLTSRHPSPQAEVLPGPSDYHIDDVGRSTTGAVFGNARRDTHEDILHKVDNPGPGDYFPEDPTAHKPESVVFGSEKQRPEKAVSPGPGPGDYNPEEPKSWAQIGPLLNSTAPRFVPNATDVPGPGYYDAIATALGNRGAVIGDAKRDTGAHFASDADGGVGPGDYQLPALDAGPMKSIGLPLSEAAHEDDALRGPGAYHVEVPGEVPSAKIGTAARFPVSLEERHAASVPGPGAYEPVDDTDKRGAVFGTGPKQSPLPEGAPVGPGTYDPQELHRPSMPSYSVGTALRFDRQREAMPHPIPGPGAYDPLLSDDGHGVVFGTSRGHDAATSPTDVPGPGAYDHMSSAAMLDSRVPNAVLGSAPQRPVARQEEVPGPADYEPRPIAEHIPTPWFNSRPLDKISETPGPGLYYVTNAADRTAPSVVFGTSRARHEDDHPDIPGPGAYAIPVLQDSVGVGIPQGPRFPSPRAEDDIPGPGSYSLALPTGTSVVLGTAQRAQEVKDSGVPGPGAYHASILDRPDAHAPTISAGERFTERASDHPGPGAYSPQEPLPNVHSYVFGGGASRPTERAGEAPGPGAYEWIVGPLGPSVAFPKAPRGQRDPREDFPGPGYYYVQTADGAPQVRFLTAPRQMDLATNKDVPGPGYYQVNATTDNQHAGYSFSQSAPRPAPSSDAPGPGAYEHTQPVVGPSFSFGQAPQHATMRVTEVPGPGAYDASLPVDGPAFSFGKFSRQQLDALAQRSVPGPGAYEALSPESGPSFSVGTAPRAGIAPPSTTPGPGAYAHTSTLPEFGGYSVPKAGRFPPNSSDGLPGPGAYEIADVLRAPNMLGSMIGTATREVRGQASDVPGPGHYEVFSNGPEGPTFSIGSKSVRFADYDRDIPGPASYEPHNPSWAPLPAHSVGTAQRFYSLQDSDMPGPGAYDHAVGDRGPSISFATAQRPLERELQKRAAEPGPGHYDPSLYAPEGPSFTFGSARSDPTNGAADLPGPGQYASLTAFGHDGPAALIRPLPLVDQDAVFARRVNAQPGPNAYTLPSQLDLRGVPMGTAPRDATSTDERAHFPGPGAYVTGGVGMFDGPKYSIPRHVRDTSDRKPGDVPGPGTYDGGRALDRLLPGVPVYSFPVAQRDGEGNGGDDSRANLGPGAYNVGAAPHAGPAYSIPQAVDFSGAAGGGNGSAPGPGMYHNPSRWGDGGYTIAGKPMDKDPSSQVPGPGHYRLHDYDPYGRDRAIGVDFSKGGERPCNVKVETIFSDMPGPGHYHRGAIQFGDGHGVSILSRIPERFSERTPGPPDYHHPVIRHPFFDPLSH